jgi:HEAT repeat protein
MARQRVFEAIEYLLLRGKPAGRREAAKALAQFEHPEAAALMIKALNDEDAEVRAQLLLQLRPRNIPAAVVLLVRMADSPDPAVRQALRAALPEFTLRRLLANFDVLDEDVRITAGTLVRKIDADASEELVKEFGSPLRVRRHRAVLVAEAMGVVHELEKSIVKLLSDNDQMVRLATARVLSDCKSRPTWEALRDAMFDRSFAVREAAEQSLLRILQTLAVKKEEEAGLEEAEEAVR